MKFCDLKHNFLDVFQRVSDQSTHSLMSSKASHLSGASYHFPSIILKAFIVCCGCRAAEDAFLDLVRQDAAQLMRLRHPGVVRVIQALDESKAAMAMVTEPIFASVANVLGRHDNISKVPSELKDLVSTCNVHLPKGSTLELCILITVNGFFSSFFRRI